MSDDFDDLWLLNDSKYLEEKNRHNKNIEKAKAELRDLKSGRAKAHNEEHRQQRIQSTREYIASLESLSKNADNTRATGQMLKNRRIAAQQAAIQAQIDEENEREGAILDKREKLLKKEKKLEKQRRKNAKKTIKDLEDFRKKMKADFDIDIDSMDEYADFFKS